MMASKPKPDILAEAIAWHLRLKSGIDRDWDEFVEWLERDPSHSEAYDKVEAGHAAMTAEAFSGAAEPAPIAANDEEPRRRWSARRFAMALAAVAALFLVAIIAVPMLMPTSDRYEVATAPGERRSVEIADGSSVMLNGATRVILDRGDPRFAELVAGEATFAVRHDAGRPFTVIAGDHRIQDIGTSFNLTHDRSEFAVEVIEGAIVYDPHRAAVRLSAGQTLRVIGNARPVLSRQDPQGLAGWRHGRLSYTEAPMSRVASDIARTLGVEVTLDRDLSDLPFTGSIRIEQNPGATIDGLAGSVGLRARRTGRGWIIEPHARATR
jgi:transmembrane sensor